MIVNNKPVPGEPKEWEEPTNPEAATDSRDKEQTKPLIEEVKRRKENLTNSDNTDEEKQS